MNTLLPAFETRRLILRGVSEKDAPDWQKHFDDYEVVRNLSAAVPWPYPKDGVLNFLRSAVLPHQGKDRWVWGIFLKDTPGELIGVVDLWREGKPEHRGFWLSRRHWGMGFMSEAVAPVLDYAFDTLGFDVLVFANALGNIGSRRIKEKTGARLLRVIPTKHVDPAFTHSEIWELSRAEWKARPREHQYQTKKIQ